MHQIRALEAGVLSNRSVLVSVHGLSVDASLVWRPVGFLASEIFFNLLGGHFLPSHDSSPPTIRAAIVAAHSSPSFEGISAFSLSRRAASVSLTRARTCEALTPNREKSRRGLRGMASNSPAAQTEQSTNPSGGITYDAGRLHEQVGGVSRRIFLSSHIAGSRRSINFGVW